MLVIVDYGLGNLGSVENMLRKLGCECRISGLADDIEKASKLILPGVGAFDEGMALLREKGLVEPLRNAATRKGTPLLGICLGMQMLTHSSEEGSSEGLGLVDAVTRKFSVEQYATKLPVPHMGWCHVKVMKPCFLTKGLNDSSRFYFVHSYYVECARDEDVALSAHYGRDFVAAFEHGNILGVQFHPEKSHKFGLQILRNYVESY